MDDTSICPNFRRVGFAVYDRESADPAQLFAHAGASKRIMMTRYGISSLAEIGQRHIAQKAVLKEPRTPRTGFAACLQLVRTCSLTGATLQRLPPSRAWAGCIERIFTGG